MILFYDTETSGIPRWDLPADDPAQPRIVQIAALAVDDFDNTEKSRYEAIVKPEGWTIAEGAAKDEPEGNHQPLLAGRLPLHPPDDNRNRRPDAHQREDIVRQSLVFTTQPKQRPVIHPRHHRGAAMG